MIEQINRVDHCWNVVGYYDDGIAKGEMVEGLPVLGGLKDISGIAQPLSMVVAIADPSVRMNVVASITNKQISFPVMVHPTALPGGVTNFFGRGTIITAGCILTTGIVTGEFVIINVATTLGHDVKLGSFCSVMPGCNISGHVKVGEGSWLGAGAKIIQQLTLGKNCKVGAGAVVTKSFGDGVTLVGVPAGVIR
jgi:sugar O-acyltransferase (sialic acid O-acetyltransferase NeuD family)